MIILQHIGGIIAYYSKRPNKNHRRFGKLIPNFAKIVVILGYFYSKNIILGIGIIIMSTLFYLYGRIKEKRKNE